MAQRLYTIQFNNVSVSAVQDLVSVYTGANIAIEVHEIVIGQISATTVGNLRLTFKRFSGSFTTGSGGTTPTPAPHNFNDIATKISSAHVNDTTQCAIGSGAVAILRADVYNVVNGFQLLPPPEDRYQIAPSQAFTLSLDSTPGSAQTMSGSLVYAELY